MKALTFHMYAAGMPGEADSAFPSSSEFSQVEERQIALRGFAFLFSVRSPQVTCSQTVTDYDWQRMERQPLDNGELADESWRIRPKPGAVAVASYMGDD